MQWLQQEQWIRTSSITLCVFSGRRRFKEAAREFPEPAEANFESRASPSGPDASEQQRRWQSWWTGVKGQVTRTGRDDPWVQTDTVQEPAERASASPASGPKRTEAEDRRRPPPGSHVQTAQSESTCDLPAANHKPPWPPTCGWVNMWLSWAPLMGRHRLLSLIRFCIRVLPPCLSVSSPVCPAHNAPEWLHVTLVIANQHWRLGGAAGRLHAR